jgi:hypothetical protein
MKKYFYEKEFKANVQLINEDNFQEYLINIRDIPDSRRLGFVKMMLEHHFTLLMERRLWLILIILDFMYQLARAPEPISPILLKGVIEKSFDIEREIDKVPDEDPRKSEIKIKFRKSKGYPFLKKTFQKLRSLQQ